ncbi:hypothetical protein ES703_36968 [subsurface metagenome]
MALKHKTKIKQSKNAYTQYLVIPSSLVRDSQYPFTEDEEVEIIIDPREKKIIVKSAEK